MPLGFYWQNRHPFRKSVFLDVNMEDFLLWGREIWSVEYVGRDGKVRKAWERRQPNPMLAPTSCRFDVSWASSPYDVLRTVARRKDGTGILLGEHLLARRYMPQVEYQFVMQQRDPPVRGRGSKYRGSEEDFYRLCAKHLHCNVHWYSEESAYEFMIDYDSGMPCYKSKSVSMTSHGIKFKDFKTGVTSVGVLCCVDDYEEYMKWLMDETDKDMGVGDETGGTQGDA